MSMKIITILIAYAVGMSVGQILFKVAANRITQGEQNFSVTQLATDPFFILAISLYGFMTILWVWILSRFSLGLAYPFVALSFVFTPAASYFVFGERIDGWYLLALTFILTGLTILLIKTQS